MYVSASSVWNVHVCLVECVIVESPVKDVKGWEQGLILPNCITFDRSLEDLTLLLTTEACYFPFLWTQIFVYLAYQSLSV